MERKTYQIKMVDLSPYGSSSRYVNLKLDSVEDCHKIIEIAHVINWEINSVNEDGLGEELIDRSVDYQEFLNKQNDDRAAWIANQNERVKRINALPKSYESRLAFPQGCKIVYERSTATFDPRISSDLRYGVSTTIHRDRISKSLYVHEYITKDKKIQVNKFARDIKFLFGEAAFEIAPQIIKNIWSEYSDLCTKIRNA